MRSKTILLITIMISMLFGCGKQNPIHDFEIQKAYRFLIQEGEVRGDSTLAYQEWEYPCLDLNLTKEVNDSHVKWIVTDTNRVERVVKIEIRKGNFWNEQWTYFNEQGFEVRHSERLKKANRSDTLWALNLSRYEFNEDSTLAIGNGTLVDSEGLEVKSQYKISRLPSQHIVELFTPDTTLALQRIRKFDSSMRLLSNEIRMIARGSQEFFEMEYEEDRLVGIKKEVKVKGEAITNEKTVLIYDQSGALKKKVHLDESGNGWELVYYSTI